MRIYFYNNNFAYFPPVNTYQFVHIEYTGYDAPLDNYDLCGS
jgi:hypothetical protein